jgi:hypothetical protein
MLRDKEAGAGGRVNIDKITVASFAWPLALLHSRPMPSPAPTGCVSCPMCPPGQFRALTERLDALGVHSAG